MSKTKTAAKTTTPKPKDITLNVRVSPDVVAQLDEVADLMARQQGDKVPRSQALRPAILRGIPVLLEELKRSSKKST